MPTPKRWRAYVAVGDSFSEGLMDEDAARPGSYRGWADRLAEHLATVAAQDGEEFRYANLAIRGRKLHDVVGEQLDAALELKPDLVSLVGGGNDILRPRADMDAIVAQMEEAVVRVRTAGADVLLATPTDPRDAGPLLQRTRTRAGLYAAALFSIAHRHDCYIVDQWRARYLADWRMWADDRIHMRPDGHRRVALEAFTSLGFEPADLDWRTPLPPRPPATRAQTMRGNLTWVRRHVRPWVLRRVTGRSSGDTVRAKQAEWRVVEPTMDG